MNAERWRRIEEACQAALDRPPAERSALLDRMCGDDEKLRAEVESLMAERDRAEVFFDTSAWQAAAADFEDDIEDAVPALVPGRRLGPFVIERRVGAGGMGEVYRVRDTRLDRTVAIKVLPIGVEADEENRQRLRLEARTISSLAHPHICALFDIRSDEGIDYLVMEYLEGQTLAERMRAADGERVALPLDEAIAYAAQIADALAAAHRRGIVHCDLKPANIVLTKEGVKLLDFGIARAHRARPIAASVSGAEQSPATNAPVPPTALLGTLNYMAPEQLAGSEPDHRSDLFAFGAVLFEMLTGRRAFDGESVALAARGVLDVVPPPVSRYQPLATPMLDGLVRRCLVKDPDERWDSARLAADELRAIAQQCTSPVAASSDGRVGAGSRRPGPSRGRLALGAAALLPVAVVLVFGLAWSAERRTLPLNRLDLDLGSHYHLHPRYGFAMISPDGSRLLFRATDADGAGHLYLRRLDQPDAVLLRGTRDAMYPFFSPDGAWVGFFLPSGLYKISIRGGEPISVCETSQATVRGASWGDDGTIVAALGSAEGLSKIASSGGPAVPLTRLDVTRHDVTHRWPQMLPGSHAVLFTAHVAGGRYDDASIEVQALGSRERRTLYRGGYFGRYISSGHLVFVRHNTLYAAPMDLAGLKLTGPPVSVLKDVVADADIGRMEFSATDSGSVLCLTGAWQPDQVVLTWRDASGRPDRLAAVAGGYADPRVSPRGDRIAVSAGEGTLTRRQIAILHSGRREPLKLISNGHDLSPIWAPDGEHVVFGSDRHGGMHNLYWARSDGSGPVVRLTNANHLQVAFSFTPDGSRLAYVELDPSTGQDIWTVPLDLRDPDRPVPGKPEPLIRTPLDEGDPQFSPDGRWIAYDVTEGGTTEVYVQRANAGAAKRWQVSRGDGAKPVWGPRGDELLYQGPKREIFTVPFSVRDDRFVAGEPRSWAGVQLPAYDGSYTARNFDVSPDGRRLLLLEPASAEQQPRAAVTLLTNFFDEVRRRTSER